MTQQEEQEFQQMKFDLRSISNNVGNLTKQVSEIYHALVGSPIAKDGGALKKLDDNIIRTRELDNKITVVREEIDKKFDIFSKEIFTKVDELKMSNTKQEIYIRIICALGGVVGSGVIALIIRLLSK